MFNIFKGKDKNVKKAEKEYNSKNTPINTYQNNTAHQSLATFSKEAKQKSKNDRKKQNNSNEIYLSNIVCLVKIINSFKKECIGRVNFSGHINKKGVIQIR